jgi:hypothetical protein
MVHFGFTLNDSIVAEDEVVHRLKQLGREYTGANQTSYSPLLYYPLSLALRRKRLHPMTTRLTHNWLSGLLASSKSFANINNHKHKKGWQRCL